MTTTKIPRRTIEHFHTIAARKSGVTGWEPYAYERIGDALVMKGGVPRILTAGPRKGDKTWDRATATQVVVTDFEADQEAQQEALREAVEEKR
ncbi:hypothetical protein [Cupriavidus malaysiensis]|uniref:Uncharacterized protein n=1 Tax=Cupriavidus malaysiensis TaxID=367825 RepID=A0ABN4U0F8_9BURK|nr:hypothetical protein [Cupriavidus malaysiensis]AOZ11101.1 hypothetical protein BKK80_34645 [Cupriavidus malaysiensis]